MENYIQKLVLRIDWSEIDAFGHINNLQIMKYIQAARVEYLLQPAFTEATGKKNLGPVLASINCQFVKPLFFPGNITVYSKIEFVKTTSFKMVHELYNDNQELVAKSEDIIVLYDHDKHEKTPIPEHLKAKMLSEK